MSVSAVVVAAGRGERFGAQKQFLTLGESTIAAASVAAARCVADTVVLVVPDTYSGSGEGADIVVTGGATRSSSVRHGLDVLGDVDVVVVHDAARPLATPALFHAVVRAVHAGAAGAVPALEITDTVKRVQRSDITRVVETVDRTTLVTVQTPQAFRLSELREAHHSGAEATDDAALLELRGALVVAVPGEPTNIKVTVPEDLVRVRELVKES
jgi:2-C-methyl-D-erythritol 4-phosphate cytidylyltransferase